MAPESSKFMPYSARSWQTHKHLFLIFGNVAIFGHVVLLEGNVIFLWKRRHFLETPHFFENVAICWKKHITSI